MVVLSGCDSPPAGDKNADSDLVMLYAQLLLLNEEYKTSSPGMTLEEFHSKSEGILLAHKTNKEEFLAQVQAVSNEPESFRLFYDEVSKSVQELSKKQ